MKRFANGGWQWLDKMEEIAPDLKPKGTRAYSATNATPANEPDEESDVEDAAPIIPSAVTAFVPGAAPAFVPGAAPAFVPGAAPAFVPSATPIVVPMEAPTFTPNTASASIRPGSTPTSSMGPPTLGPFSMDIDDGEESLTGSSTLISNPSAKRKSLPVDDDDGPKTVSTSSASVASQPKKRKASGKKPASVKSESKAPSSKASSSKGASSMSSMSLPAGPTKLNPFLVIQGMQGAVNRLSDSIESSFAIDPVSQISQDALHGAQSLPGLTKDEVLLITRIYTRHPHLANSFMGSLPIYKETVVRQLLEEVQEFKNEGMSEREAILKVGQ